MKTTIKDNGDGTMTVKYFYGTMIAAPVVRPMVFDHELERVPGTPNEFRIVR